VEKNPLEGEALLMIGEYHARTGEREKAEFRFDMASKINGFEAESYVKHAQMLVGQQKYDKALELLQKAQKVKPRENVQRYLEAVQRVARARS
jgi:tetratricopeptide (TPR) repeat protein